MIRIIIECDNCGKELLLIPDNINRSYRGIMEFDIAIALPQKNKWGIVCSRSGEAYCGACISGMVQL